MSSFEVNLSLVLAHTVQYEVAQEYPPEHCAHLRNGGDDPVDPTAAAESQYDAFVKYGPRVADVYRDKFIPLSADITRENANQYKQYAPGLNKVGQDIYFGNAQRQAEFDAAQTAQGSAGAQAVANALQLQQQAEPEYYQSRSTASDLIQQLASLVKGDSPVNLSGSEQEEIARGLNRLNGTQGNLGNSSPWSTINNAMTFGQAGEQKRQNRINQLSQAIQTSASSLPAFRTNVDPYKIATGKTSAAQYGDKNFASEGIGYGVGIGQNAFNNYGNFTTNYQSGVREDEGVLGDVLTGSKIFSNIAGGAGGMAMCWVAREVFGTTDGRWLQFRDWLLTDGPDLLVQLYYEEGQRFAQWLRNKPVAKWLIKQAMIFCIK